MTGLTLGQSSFLVAVLMMVFCWFYDRRQICFGTVIYQIVYSACTDLLRPLVHHSPWRVLNVMIMLGGNLSVCRRDRALFVYRLGKRKLRGADLCAGRKASLADQGRAHRPGLFCCRPGCSARGKVWPVHGLYDPSLRSNDTVHAQTAEAAGWRQTAGGERLNGREGKFHSAGRSKMRWTFARQREKEER